MLLNSSFPFNPSYKIHVFIGVILGLLLGFILIVLQPFNINNFNHDYGEALLMGFGLIKFINYLLAHFVEAFFYKKKKSWNWWNEITFLILSSISGAILGYIYLDIFFEKQPLSFLRLILFFFYIVLPLFPLIIFPKLVLRYLLSKNLIKHSKESVSQIENIQTEKLTLKGQNAKDEITVSEEQLLYVKSIDNYVMVYYLDGEIKNKILRSKLSDILTQVPFLIQPHRSYLINPNHSFKIKGNSQKATLNSADFKEVIPIARTSYKTVKAIFN